MQGFGLIDGFDMSMITDDMLYAQNGRRFLWTFSPEQEQNKRLGKMYGMYIAAKKMYGENSKEAQDAYNDLPEEAKCWREEFRRCVKPPRRVWAYEFMLHLSKGTLTKEALELISESIIKNQPTNET